MRRLSVDAALRLFWSKNVESIDPPRSPREQPQHQQNVPDPANDPLSPRSGSRKKRSQAKAEPEPPQNQGKGSKLSLLHAVDLHLLQVSEALAAVHAILLVLAWRGEIGRWRVIPGRGNHSAANVALLRPQVIAWLQKRGFRYELDNAGGTIYVDL